MNSDKQLYIETRASENKIEVQKLYFPYRWLFKKKTAHLFSVSSLDENQICRSNIKEELHLLTDEKYLSKPHLGEGIDYKLYHT